MWVFNIFLNCAKVCQNLDNSAMKIIIIKICIHIEKEVNTILVSKITTLNIDI